MQQESAQLGTGCKDCHQEAHFITWTKATSDIHLHNTVTVDSGAVEEQS